MIIFIVIIVIFFADNFTHIECPNFSTEPPLVIRSIAAFFPAWLTGEKKKRVEEGWNVIKAGLIKRAASHAFTYREF